MMDCIIYMVTYLGQYDSRTGGNLPNGGQSPYTYTAYTWDEAERLKADLETEFPNRTWSICEKDVS